MDTLYPAPDEGRFIFNISGPTVIDNALLYTEPSSHPYIIGTSAQTVSHIHPVIMLASMRQRSVPAIWSRFRCVKTRKNQKTETP